MKRIIDNIHIIGLAAFILVVTQALLCPGANAQVACLTGIVSDVGGTPVIRGDLDFDDALTGQRLFTPGDNTNEFGYYSVCVFGGIYHVSFAPPLGTHLVGRKFFNLDLRTGREMNVTLATGVVITGVISDELGAPVGGVDVDVDSVGAGRVYTPDDDTDTLFVTGVYRVVVPPHLYRIRFDPPAGSRLRGVEINAVTIQNDTTINVPLSPGLLVSGLIFDNLGAPAGDIEVSLRSLITGEKIFLSNNKSDTLGAYSVAAAPGQFRMEFLPPLGSPLVGSFMDSVTISSDIVINAVLRAGNRISVEVKDENGAPVVRADLDITIESTRVRQFIPHDKTDINGRTTVAVPPDIYEIRIDPPPGTLLDQEVLRDVNITSDTTIFVTLPPLNRVNVSGRVVDQNGNGLANIAIGAESTATGNVIKVKSGRTGAGGFYIAGVPFGLVNLLFIPPVTSRYVATKLSGISLLSDTTVATVTLSPGIIATIQVIKQNGVPARGYRISLTDESTGAGVFTPHSTTTIATGIAVVPPGVYTISVTPPSGVSGSTTTISGAMLLNDTSFTIFLGTPGQTAGGFALQQNYPNPFNGSTRLPYTLFKDSQVSLVIYDVLGRRVRSYRFGFQSAGYYNPLWDGHSDGGSRVASGIYLFQISANGESASKTMLFLQ